MHLSVVRAWALAVHGRQIVRASLHIHMSQGALVVADVCTIAAPGWPEGTGTGRAPAATNESSYDWMRAPGPNDTLRTALNYGAVMRAPGLLMLHSVTVAASAATYITPISAATLMAGHR